MKRLVKILIWILVFISLLSVVMPVLPPHTWYSKYILTNNPIILKLGLDKKDCSYEEAQMVLESHSASILCVTKDKYRLTSDTQKAVINEMRNILEKNGWKFLEKESWQFWDTTYKKGLRKIRIYPYDWGPGCTGVIVGGFDSCKLIVRIE